ncbi:hypothetical protein DMA11_23055 [Marinilabiliaceae bacterium JC017]|nr:hypothetical protein DMA11_23055 [Marinilabiliaceae bacterium JC017]
MKKNYFLLILIAVTMLFSCNPKVSTSLMKNYEPLDYKEEVMVIARDEPLPDCTEELGEVKVGDSGFTTNCGYAIVLDKVKLEARKAGGNAIKIIEHKPPTAMGSSCHRITAKILKVDNIEPLKINKKKEELLNVDYAILHIFRYSGPGSLVGYDLHLGDSVLCRVKNNFKTTLHIKKDGMNTLWARTESLAEIPVDFKYGKEYYLKCGIKMGAFVGQPVLELIDPELGGAEFKSFNAKNQ